MSEHDTVQVVQLPITLPCYSGQDIVFTNIFGDPIGVMMSVENYTYYIDTMVTKIEEAVGQNFDLGCIEQLTKQLVESLFK